MKKTFLTLFTCLTTCMMSAQQIPLVYPIEHTGSHYAMPEMPGYNQLKGVTGCSYAGKLEKNVMTNYEIVNKVIQK